MTLLRTEVRVARTGQRQLKDRSKAGQGQTKDRQGHVVKFPVSDLYRFAIKAESSRCWQERSGNGTGREGVHVRC